MDDALMMHGTRKNYHSCSFALGTYWHVRLGSKSVRVHVPKVEGVLLKAHIGAGELDAGARALLGVLMSIRKRAVILLGLSLVRSVTIQKLQ